MAVGGKLRQRLRRLMTSDAELIGTRRRESSATN
jgi:hypothetical protein